MITNRITVSFKAMTSLSNVFNAFNPIINYRFVKRFSVDVGYKDTIILMYIIQIVNVMIIV